MLTLSDRIFPVREVIQFTLRTPGWRRGFFSFIDPQPITFSVVAVSIIATYLPNVGGNNEKKVIMAFFHTIKCVLTFIYRQFIRSR